MRFRRRSFGSGRIAREPLTQFRSYTLQGLANGTPASMAAINYFALGLDNTEFELTIRRIRAFITFLYGITLNTLVTGDLVEVFQGCYMGRIGETIRDPALAAGNDQREQWLWLNKATLQITTGVTGYFLTPSHNRDDQAGLLDLRTMRKVDQDMQLVWAASYPLVTDITGHGHSASAVSIGFSGMTSLVYSRTMRRR